MAYLTKLVLDLISKIMEKTEDGTYDRSTDSNEAISEAIAGLGGGGLSDKEKSLLGIGVFPGFQDFFNTVANGAAPDIVNWSVITTGSSVSKVEIFDTDKPGYLMAQGLGSAGDDAASGTQNKRVFSFKEGVTTIFLKTRLYMRFESTGTPLSFGLIRNNDAVSRADWLSTNAAGRGIASIAINGGVPNVYSDGSSVLEITNVSTWVTDQTWFDFEIRITSSDVKFYIDGTLRVTHSTRVPDSVWQLVIAATRFGTEWAIIRAQYVQVWGV